MFLISLHYVPEDSHNEYWYLINEFVFFLYFETVLINALMMMLIQRKKMKKTSMKQLMLIFSLGELCFIWVHRKGGIEGFFSQQVNFPTTRIYLQELPEKEFQIFNNTYLVLCHKMWGYMVIIGVNFYLCNNSMSTEKNSMNTVVLLCLYIHTAHYKILPTVLPKKKNTQKQPSS